MPARQVIGCGRKVHVQSSSIACYQACSTSLLLVLEEGIPSLRKRIHIQEETTDTLTDQVIAGTSQDSRRRWICIQAIAKIICDEDPVENVSKYGGKFAIGVTKSPMCFSMFVAESPEGIDIQKYRKDQCEEKRRNQTRTRYGMVAVNKKR
jgi:hypothetical protein